jgi:hypothetical protein
VPKLEREDVERRRSRPAAPTIGQAINGGFPWLEVKCSRCRTSSSVDLASINRPPDTPVHLLEGRLDCRRCKKAEWMGGGVLDQLAPHRRCDASETDWMCNLYSITTNQATIIALFRVVNRYVGNLPPMPGVFPDYPAPVVRNVGTDRELSMMRWGMPPPPKFGGPPVTNIRNTNRTGGAG